MLGKAAVVSGVCDDEQIVAAYSQQELNELWTLRDAPPLPCAELLAEPEVSRMPKTLTRYAAPPKMLNLL